MVVNKILLKDFRNIESSELNVSAENIILTGANGQGKTNLLEAVYILCYGSSFRTQNLRDAVNYNNDSFFLKMSFEDSMHIPRTADVSFDGNKKTIRLDEHEIRDRKELIFNIPCIVFSHDDMEIVRGEPENRRRFFDQTMTMYDSLFFDDLRRYKQILRQRNAVLKEQKYSLLDVYDEKLALYGKNIILARSKACNSFDSIFPDIYREVSRKNTKINITYRPAWDVDFSIEQIVDKLRQQRDTDIKMNTTTTGPHRDRFVISDENGIFANGASTGQMRLASLVLRSAQAAFYRVKTGKDPVFLIDDVLLELDPEKRTRYINYLGHYSQAFFTFLPEERYFSSINDFYGGKTIRYTVENGSFKGQK